MSKINWTRIKNWNCSYRCRRFSSFTPSLLHPFANPNIKDSVNRICSESSAKLPKFLIPTIQDNLATGGSIEYGTLILAAWCYYSDKGRNENNEPLEIIDEKKGKLHQTASTTNNKLFTKKYKEMIQLLFKLKEIKRVMNEMI